MTITQSFQPALFHPSFSSVSLSRRSVIERSIFGRAGGKIAPIIEPTSECLRRDRVQLPAVDQVSLNERAGQIPSLMGQIGACSLLIQGGAAQIGTQTLLLGEGMLPPYTLLAHFSHRVARHTVAPKHLAYRVLQRSPRPRATFCGQGGAARIDACN